MARTVVSVRGAQAAASALATSEVAPVTGAAVAPQAAPPESDGLPEKLVKYVPAETLAFFVAVSAALTSSHELAIIIVTVIAAAGTPTYLWTVAPNDDTAPKAYFYVLSVFAFVCWAIGTSGPLQSIIGIEQNDAGVVLAAGAFVIPLLDTVCQKLKIG